MLKTNMYDQLLFKKSLSIFIRQFNIFEKQFSQENGISLRNTGNPNYLKINICNSMIIMIIFKFYQTFFF